MSLVEKNALKMEANDELSNEIVYQSIQQTSSECNAINNSTMPDVCAANNLIISDANKIASKECKKKRKKKCIRLDNGNENSSKNDELKRISTLNANKSYEYITNDSDELDEDEMEDVKLYDHQPNYDKESGADKLDDDKSDDEKPTNGKIKDEKSDCNKPETNKPDGDKQNECKHIDDNTSLSMAYDWTKKIFFGICSSLIRRRPNNNPLASSCSGGTSNDSGHAKSSSERYDAID